MRMVALGVVVAALVPARALANESLTATGSITYTWQGEPGLGCAAVGLCDVEGALIVDAQGQSELTSFSGNSVISLPPSSPNVRVFSGTGVNAGECVDAPSGPGLGALFIRHAGRGRLVARPQPPLSSGRCAGPLASDLARLGLPVRKTGGKKRASFDLRTSKAFVAGPFAGTLVSTVVLRPGGGSGGVESGGSSGSFFGPPGSRHKVLVEHVSLHYRVASLPDVLQTSFSGEPDPFCDALDSCRATGTVALSLEGVQNTLTLNASRRVTRSAGARRALADLRRGRLRLDFSGLTSSLLAAETFVPADGSRCQESSTSQGQLSLGSGHPGTALQVSLSAGGELDVLRTYCPGPSQSDVFGSEQGSPRLARGSISVAQLLGRHSTIALTNSGSFSGVGYAGSRAGALGLSLSLERVTAGTVEESAP